VKKSDIKKWHKNLVTISLLIWLFVVIIIDVFQIFYLNDD